jgi:hypothetical protein
MGIGGSHFFFVKSGRPNACLNVVNEKGDELSLAGDDSAGTMRHYGRLSLAKFSGNQQIGEEIFGPTAEEFLKALADHLGYTVAPK